MISAQHYYRLLLFVLAVSGWIELSVGLSQEPSPQGGVAFDIQSLSRPPEIFPTDMLSEEGVQAIFYRGVPYQGNESQVFAYYGLPKRSDPTEKVPAVVLVHGGGGTAFARWVRLWNDRGYAAIAMDLCGCIPKKSSAGGWERSAKGGPPGWDASFEQIDAPIQDQWQTHAISAIVLANSWLRSLPEVDSDRIGITGISWGGYLTCIASGVDDRFRCAVPVYGCGFLGENSVWVPTLERMDPARAKRWLDQWDPSVYLPKAKMPILWVNGTNDFAYPMDSWQRSHELVGPSTLSLRIEMPHGHGPAGENPEEIHVFMNSVLKGGKPFPSFVEILGEGPHWSARFRSPVPITKGELCFTRDGGNWKDRKWIATEAKWNQESISIDIPADARVWYFNLYDDRGCATSTPFHERRIVREK
jgi:dienelactone hydrolase